MTSSLETEVSLLGDAWTAESWWLEGSWNSLQRTGLAQHLHPELLLLLPPLLSALEQSIEAIGESPEIVGCLRTR